MDSSEKRKRDELQDQALKGTFPASDPASTNEADREPIRPVHRRPPRIDRDLVNDLADEVEQKNRRDAAQRDNRGRTTK